MQVYWRTKWIEKICMTLGFKQKTLCILCCISDHCTMSVHTFIFISVSALYKSIFWDSGAECHLLAGVGRPARAPLRPPPWLQPWRHLPAPPLGYLRSPVWHGSTALKRQCDAGQPPNWDFIGLCWHRRVGRFQCIWLIQWKRVTSHPWVGQATGTGTALVLCAIIASAASYSVQTLHVIA